MIEGLYISEERWDDDNDTFGCKTAAENHCFRTLVEEKNSFRKYSA